MSPWWWIPIGVLVLLALVALRDVFFQRSHAIIHNFPIVGHLRYWLETIGPELRQYWVANDSEERPFDRQERSWIYATAKGQNNYFGFGTTQEVYSIGYPVIKHAALPFPTEKAQHVDDDPTSIPSLKILGERHGRRRPYRPRSVLYVSAMSFGSLGKNAISALNLGAKEARCLHNTGEGGVSTYHRHGADLMWQIGTGYFGARGSDGEFSLDVLAAEVETTPEIRCIEIKLSQGAKPGKGGILPAKKVTPEIASTRKVPPWKNVLSPNCHSQFDSVDSLIDFVECIAERTGLPVGVKSAVGRLGFWEDLARRMHERGEGPDFIAIDGKEGGTGAAPLTWSDHVALPFKIGFGRVYRLFQEQEIDHELTWIGSGKLGFPDRSVVAFAMGCDLVAMARESMLAIGCIQAQKCHTGHCPAGIATMSRWFQAGLDVEEKAERFNRFVRGFRKELLALAHTSGYEHPAQFQPDDVELSTGVNRFSTLEEVLGYRKTSIPFPGMKALRI